MDVVFRLKAGLQRFAAALIESPACPMIWL